MASSLANSAVNTTTPTDLAAERLYLSVEQVAERLPRPALPISDDALEDYLNTLFQLGRLHHTPNISPRNVAL